MEKIPEYLRDTVYWVFSGKARRKEKDVTSDDKVYLQDEFLQCLAVEMELAELVNLPNGVLLQEWIASHTVALFEHINLIYGVISEFCTMSGCPEMIGAGNKIYLWVDERGKRSKVSAPHYIDYVMTYLQKTLNDESIFPTKADKDFPTSFEIYTRKIYRLLFHVLAHIYHMHFNEIVILDLHKHLNCTFAHLILFNQQFNLIEPKELDVLNDLAIALKLVPDNQNESMQTSTTPEPSLPTSLNLSNSIEQYLDNKDLTNELNHNLDSLQSNNFNQLEANQHNQRKKHSRQHSYTASQTISSPTNYIKRFISSLSPNSTANNNSNNNNNLSQSCAINEENNSSANQTIQSTQNVIITQSKSPFSIRNQDPEQNDLCNQENQNEFNSKLTNQKIVLNNSKRSETDFSTISNSTNKTHKYQQSTPIFFSGSLFKSTKLIDINQTPSEAKQQSIDDENDVQLNNKKAIKENTKLLNSDQILNDDFCSSTRRTTSTSAIQYLQQSNVNFSIFSPNNNIISNLNENLMNEDYLLDDQTTTMSYNQSGQLNDSNLNLDQMDTTTTSSITKNTEFELDVNDEQEIKNSVNLKNTTIKQQQPTFTLENRTFGSLEIDENNIEFDNNLDNLDSSSSDHRTSSNRRNVCALTD